VALSGAHVAEAPPPADSPEDRAYRRGFKRADRRDDYALDRFDEAEANLGDPPRVGRILLELTRYYNPLIHGPIVDVDTRRRVLEALDAARPEEARRLLQERRALYVGPDTEPR